MNEENVDYSEISGDEEKTEETSTETHDDGSEVRPEAASRGRGAAGDSAVDGEPDRGAGLRTPPDPSARYRRETAARESEDALIGRLGLTDPYTRQPITTMAQLREYQEKKAREQRERIMTRAGLSEDEYNDFVSTIPEVRRAREEAAKAQEIISRQRETEARANIDAQIREISALDPSIKSIDDLAKEENFEELYGYVRRGYALADAYKLTNMSKLQGKAAEASRQAAYNSQAGRSGMERRVSRGDDNGDVSVPPETARLYRAFFPDATEAEIRRHYNNTRKKGK